MSSAIPGPFAPFRPGNDDIVRIPPSRPPLPANPENANNIGDDSTIVGSVDTPNEFSIRQPANDESNTSQTASQPNPVPPINQSQNPITIVSTNIETIRDASSNPPSVPNLQEMTSPQTTVQTQQPPPPNNNNINDNNNNIPSIGQDEPENANGNNGSGTKSTLIALGSTVGVVVALALIVILYTKWMRYLRWKKLRSFHRRMNSFSTVTSTHRPSQSQTLQ